MKILRQRPLHPFLIAAYAVLALLANNIDQVKITDGFRSLVFLLAYAGTIWVVLRLVTKEWLRSAILTTLLLALFFSYGHVYGFLKQHAILDIDLGRHRWLLPIWIILGIAGTWWAFQRKRDLPTTTSWMNVTLIFAIIFPIVQIASFEIRSLTADTVPQELLAEYENLKYSQGQRPPDIYLIILDGYGRQDILNTTFHYDNTDFVDALADMGFYVATCSMSNYAQTELSLTTLLNLDYLEAFGNFPEDSEDRTPLRPLQKHSLVRKSLEELGYQIVAFDSGFYRTQFTDADIYLSTTTESVGGINGFETMLIRTSAGLLFTDAALILPRFLTSDIESMDNERRRSQVLYILEKLPEVSTDVPGPKFVFAHIMSPHDPYVFNANGEPVSYPTPLTPEDQVTGYREQAIYISSQIIPILQAIIDQSEVEPIIILMSDHGPGWASMDGRMSILNAYYLPEVQEQIPYANITPVNSFRVIFNAIFGGDFPLLEDISYFSLYQEPYNFQTVLNTCEDQEFKIP